MAQPNTQTAVAVVEQSAEGGMVEWNLDGFPEAQYNRLVPVETLQVPTDLLRPVVQIVKANPDPKNGGDVYQSHDTPPGHAAPTKVLLRKFATAAGISFTSERRTDDGSNPDVCEVTCIAEMLLPTGQRLTAVGSKRVDLSAQTWSSPAHRAKYKSFFQEHVSSRAQNRAIRSLLSLRGSYPIEMYQRPFAVVSFAPNMAHPEVRARILDAMAGTTAQLYGPAAAAQITAGQTINVTPAPDDDEAPAPAPRVLPGERLAKAETAAEPDWFAAADPQPAATTPSLVAILRDTAAASNLQGEATEPQKRTLWEIVKPFGFETFAAGVKVAFGLDVIEGANGPVIKLTAAQAQTIVNVARSDGPERFAARWAEMAAAA